MFVDLFPGMRAETLRHQLAAPGIKGIVLKTYGAGNAPTAEWFTDAINQAVKDGKVVLNVTQCVNGGVHKRYVSADTLANAGVVSGGDMTAEAAITKMMFLFGLGMDARQVADGFAHALCGEVTL